MSSDCRRLLLSHSTQVLPVTRQYFTRLTPTNDLDLDKAGGVEKPVTGTEAAVLSTTAVEEGEGVVSAAPVVHEYGFPPTILALTCSFSAGAILSAAFMLLLPEALFMIGEGVSEPALYVRERSGRADGLPPFGLLLMCERSGREQRTSAADERKMS